MAEASPRERAQPAPDYLPIRDYAAIGDCHGAALVARDGSIDWCCLGRFDAEPVFCRVLDAGKGGFLSLRPTIEFTSDRAYVDGTNVLRTVFATAGGTASVTDFMPVGRRPGAGVHDYVRLVAPHWLVRVIDGIEGEVRFDLAYRPAIDFARRPAALRLADGRVDAEGGTTLYHDMPIAGDGRIARGEFAVRAGERRRLILARAPATGPSALDRITKLLDITTAFWREWIAYCRYRGPYGETVRRSALVLKLMTYAPTGALVAALTSSLPEQIGGDRNWDYRYCWLRDASFTLYALGALGYGGEAHRFNEFLGLCCRVDPASLQIMYGIEAESDLREQRHDHLDGYRGSRPVRSGNGAYDQRQIDVYGELLDWAALVVALGGGFDRDSRAMLAALADFVCAHWHEPDSGLWEMRGPPRHHVHGKAMCWVALDRALALFGRRDAWAATRERIAADLRTRGIDPAGGHFVQAYGRPETDAALLLLPMLGFPADADTVERTVAAVTRELGRGDFLLRYAVPDGLDGDEGAFLICSFWLVDALLAVGRADEARALFERLVASANDVGLYAEEIDPADGAFLGNFPQAFTHLALVGAAANLELFERGGRAAVAGSHAERARRGIQAVFGWRSLWAALRQSGRIGRLRSSRRSALPPRLAG